MGTPKALLRCGEAGFVELMIGAQYKAGIRHVVVVTQLDLLDQIKSSNPTLMAHQEAFVGHPEAMQIDWVGSDPDRPQLHSLQQACAHLKGQPADGQWPALLLGPVDQGPYPGELIELLLEGAALQSDQVRVPAYQNQPGHPVLLGAGWVHHVLEDHPEGLRGLLETHAPHKERVVTHEAATRHNLNTPALLSQFLADVAPTTFSLLPLATAVEPNPSLLSR